MLPGIDDDKHDFMNSLRFIMLIFKIKTSMYLYYGGLSGNIPFKIVLFVAAK